MSQDGKQLIDLSNNQVNVLPLLQHLSLDNLRFVKENNELKEANNKLITNNTKLLNECEQEKLRNKILLDDIIKRDEQIGALNGKIKHLEDENKSLTERLNIKDKKEIISKFLQAFQDINRFEQFEKKCHPNVLNSLVKVRKSRNLIAHFVEPTIEAFDKSCAYVALFKALQKIKPNIQSEIDNKYPGVIDFYQVELLKIVQPKDYSEEDLESFKEYFEV